MRNPLIVITIDVTKAFVSVKKMSVEALKNSKISPGIINSVAGVYVGDKVRVEINK